MSLVFFVFPPSIIAQSLSFPLQGYYHPGRAMPVRWASQAAGGAIELSATGAVTTQIDSTSSTRGVFPWLVINSAAGNTSDMSLPPLHPLDDNNVLLINTAANVPTPDDLFPNQHVISLHLDPADLTGSPMAWESIDAIVVTPQIADKLRLLLPQRVRWILVSDRPSFQRGQAVIMGTSTSGFVMPPVISPDAYAPTEGWTAGRSTDFRRQVFLLGSVYCLVILGISLWRSRWNFAAIIGASAVACVVFGRFDHTQSPISQQRGVVHVTGHTWLDDSWLYQVAHRPTDFRVPVGGNVTPVLSDLSQLSSLALRLQCDGQGYPVAITGHLSADIPLALLNRDVIMRPGFAASQPVSTPLRLLAPLYPGTSITGQCTDPSVADSWPTLILSAN